MTLFFIFIFCIRVHAQTDKWLVTKSTHFIVYYKNAPSDFIDDVIRNAEDYYNKIADELGFRRYNFWLWDNRAKIYIYDDAKDYQAGTGQPEWSYGAANVRDKIINSFPYAQGFFDSILPHEMGHIIFREFIGFNNPALPLWFDEGVACYQESLRNPAAIAAVKDALSSGKLIGLEALSEIDIQSHKDNDFVGLFYAEAASVIDYLINEFGKDGFVQFCQAIRDKKSLSAALSSTYSISSLKDLNQGWQKHLSEGK